MKLHPQYRARLLQAGEDDTVYLDNLYDVGWPDAPHRILRNKVVDAWEAAGRPQTGHRPGEGEIVARSDALGEAVRYRPFMASADVEGDIDTLQFWCGQGVGLVRKIMPAAEILREIHGDAVAILKALGNVRS